MGDPPFRAEVIGSLLRPRILKDTATAIANGKAAAADYQVVLEREIGRVVARQEEIGTQGRHRRRVRPHLLVRLLLRRPRRLSPGTLAVPLSRHRGRRLRMADLRRHRADPSPRADHARRIPTREALHARRRCPRRPCRRPAPSTSSASPSRSIRRSTTSSATSTTGRGLSHGACRACPGGLHLRADGRGAGGDAVRSAGARAGQG